MRVYLCATEGSHKQLWEYICLPQKDRMNLLWEYICLPQKDRMNICESIFVYHRRIAWTFCESIFVYHRRIARTFVRVYLCTTEGSHEHVWEYICLPQKDRMNMCESIFVYHRRIAWTFVWEYIYVPQKDRMNICESIFVYHRRIAWTCVRVYGGGGGGGMINANDSIDFERKSKRVLVKAATYPKFLDCFKNKFQPSVKIYLNASSRKSNSTSKGTNNNCKRSNHIMKLHANWKENT